MGGVNITLLLTTQLTTTWEIDPVARHWTTPSCPGEDRPLTMAKRRQEPLLSTRVSEEGREGGTPPSISDSSPGLALREATPAGAGETGRGKPVGLPRYRRKHQEWGGSVPITHANLSNQSKQSYCGYTWVRMIRVGLHLLQ